MSDLQSEIINAITEIQTKLGNSNTLTERDLEFLLLSALIEEEA